MKELNPEELGKFNGENGKPAYIVHAGVVYDVTRSRMWQGGIHMQRHSAGKDLTVGIEAAPHGLEVLERYPRVAEFKITRATAGDLPPFLSRILGRFPMLKRHPHPMTVHFPIVFMTSTTFFSLLYLATGISSFDSTALDCLGAGLLFTPAAMATGYYTWWLNYMARPIRPVILKQRFSLLLLAVAAAAFLWRIAVPDILTSFSAASWLYLILVLSLFPLVTVIGWLGSSLTFPVEKD